LIANRLSGSPAHVTRLARGLATGSTLEFANRDMLADAFAGRQPF
jgi:recombination protein RecR